MWSNPERCASRGGRRGGPSLHFQILTRLVALVALSIGACTIASAQADTAASVTAQGAGAPSSGQPPRVQLGVGDSVQILVYGQGDLGATVSVADDGTIPVALVGSVPVAGLSPSEAAKRIEEALRNGKFVNDPHVTISVSQSISQRVSVLGEVGAPGRYAIDGRTTIFELLAQAGGTRETSAEEIFLVRTNPDGTSARYPIDLKGLVDRSTAMPSQSLQGGDVIIVPKAERFYVYGEIKSPGVYRLERDLTVEQAITLAGGVSQTGSLRRVEVKRTSPEGREVTKSVKLGDKVQPNDIIRVKESIF